MSIRAAMAYCEPLYCMEWVIAGEWFSECAARSLMGQAWWDNDWGAVASLIR